VPDALEQALADCEALLERERQDGAGEALIAAKEAAIGRLEAALAQAAAVDADEALVSRLQSVLAANRFSLRWSSLRAKLGMIGQPKASAPEARPRIDLVH
jgi:hypothetical protein